MRPSGDEDAVFRVIADAAEHHPADHADGYDNGDNNNDDVDDDDDDDDSEGGAGAVHPFALDDDLGKASAGALSAEGRVHSTKDSNRDQSNLSRQEQSRHPSNLSQPQSHQAELPLSVIRQEDVEEEQRDHEDEVDALDVDEGFSSSEDDVSEIRRNQEDLLSAMQSELSNDSGSDHSF